MTIKKEQTEINCTFFNTLIQEADHITLLLIIIIVFIVVVVVVVVVVVFEPNYY